MLNIGGWSSLPGAEDSGTLDTVPSGLHATLYLSSARPLLKSLWFFYNIIPPPSTTPTLPYYPSTYDYYLPPPSSAACPAFIPRVSMEGLYHHHLDRLIPIFRCSTIHKYMIGRVKMYCATMFWRQEIYTPI